MSYPQPDADEYVLNGYSFFRLNTNLSSAGDIYESAQSCHAFAIGPDSDIAKVNVAYFDDQVETFINQLSIDPGRGFVGFVAARNDSFYAPGKRPGKILMWSDAIYNADYLPTGFDPLHDRIEYIPPVLDVIQYFQPVESLTPGRSDKTFLFQKLPFLSANFYLMVPYYGRRYAMVALGNEADHDLDYELVGINFSISENDITNTNIEKTLASGTVVVSAAPAIINITEASNGVYDYLRLKISGTGGAALSGPTPLKIVVSDKAA